MENTFPRNSFEKESDGKNNPDLPNELFNNKSNDPAGQYVSMNNKQHVIVATQAHWKNVTLATFLHASYMICKLIYFDICIT